MVWCGLSLFWSSLLGRFGNDALNHVRKIVGDCVEFLVCFCTQNDDPHLSVAVSQAPFRMLKFDRRSSLDRAQCL